MRDGLNTLKRDVAQTNAKLGSQAGDCPSGNCLTTTMFLVFLAIQMVVLLGYNIYKDNKEAQAKKFYWNYISSRWTGEFQGNRKFKCRKDRKNESNSRDARRGDCFTEAAGDSSTERFEKSNGCASKDQCFSFFVYNIIW